MSKTFKVDGEKGSPCPSKDWIWSIESCGQSADTLVPTECPCFVQHIWLCQQHAEATLAGDEVRCTICGEQVTLGEPVQL